MFRSSDARIMKKVYNLSKLDWKLSGWTPYSWRFLRSMECGAASESEIPPIPAPVPGSVQQALKSAGILPDWNIGFNARACAWVEVRHWMYEVVVPREWLQAGSRFTLQCLGLDYSGWIRVNGKDAGAFRGSFVPHRFDLTALAEPGEPIRLEIIFDCPPRWMGHFGYTSEITEWKPRFNYTWDWTARLVQLGIWDDAVLEVSDGNELGPVDCEAVVMDDGATGELRVKGSVQGEAGASVEVELTGAAGCLLSETISRKDWEAGCDWTGLAIDLWHPNGQGKQQPLYHLRWRLLDRDGNQIDAGERTMGFKQLTWEACADAPAEADPWICRVNGQAVFLQGVNWTPIRPNFADVTVDEYRQRLELYRDLGFNLMRVWGGAFLEKECFYNLCDELGLLVWQELPLSSSGVENWPPEDGESIRAMEEIATSYVARRRHHVSLALWCGGNELMGNLEGGKTGIGKPVDTNHPMMERIDALFRRDDPARRFIPTSSSGPRFAAEEVDYGKGIHWDVHGPWMANGALDGDWTRYWQNDDSLLRSEAGAPGASPVDIIREHLGDCPEAPFTVENPIWRRTCWWIEWPEFLRQGGARDASLETYVEWSQARQAEALTIAAQCSKNRFPKCGGFIVWMGHDCFPCMANTAIIDFYGRPKPAALALKKVFLSPGPTGKASEEPDSPGSAHLPGGAREGVHN